MLSQISNTQSHQRLRIKRRHSRWQHLLVGFRGTAVVLLVDHRGRVASGPAIALKVNLRIAVPAYFHRVQLLIRPFVKVARPVGGIGNDEGDWINNYGCISPHEGDVNAHTAVHCGTVQTYEDSIGHRGPSRVSRPTIEADLTECTRFHNFREETAGRRANSHSNLGKSIDWMAKLGGKRSNSEGVGQHSEATLCNCGKGEFHCKTALSRQRNPEKRA